MPFPGSAFLILQNRALPISPTATSLLDDAVTQPASQETPLSICFMVLINFGTIVAMACDTEIET
jgi:hypothetical protein